MICSVGLKVTKDFNEWLAEQTEEYQRIVASSPQMRAYAYIRYAAQTTPAVDYSDLIPDGVKLYNKLKDEEE